MKTSIVLSLFGLSSLLSGCAVLDSVNPFDKSDAEIRAEQGDVAGESDRISILELSERLTMEAATPPENLFIPEPYVNTDWPQVGGNVAHVVQHTGASGPLERAWSLDVGSGSGRKGRITAPPIVANGVIYVLDANYRVLALSLIHI